MTLNWPVELFALMGHRWDIAEYLMIEPQNVRKIHIYAVPYKRARQIKMMVLSEQWPHNHAKNSHLTKDDCKLIAKYRGEGMWWDEIQRVTHHSAKFIKKMSKQYGVKV